MKHSTKQKLITVQLNHDIHSAYNVTKLFIQRDDEALLVSIVNRMRKVIKKVELEYVKSGIKVEVYQHY